MAALTGPGGAGAPAPRARATRGLYLDTHVLVWLYLARLDLFSQRARRLLERRALLVCPIVLLELEYLREVGRLRVPATEVAAELAERLGLGISDLDFSRAVRAALSETWTRDPFDRLIVGHAAAERSQLLTRDETIHAHYRRAVW